jgi:hypothetical protein
MVLSLLRLEMKAQIRKELIIGILAGSSSDTIDAFVVIEYKK